MGAGNPLIRSFDTDLYQPSTYFIDFTECYEDKKEWVKEEMISRDDYRKFEDLDEEEINQMFYDQLEFDVKDFMEDYFFNEPFENQYTAPDQKDRYQKDLSAQFLGGATVIAESDDAYILTTSDSEYHHFAIGIVPKFRFEELCEDVDYEQQHKYDWYEARGKDYDAMCTKLAEKLYAKKLKAFLKNNEPTMRILHSHYGKQMSSRNGAWCSFSIKTIGKTFKFL